jgi:pilus assembly protein Flp/PilA
MQTVREQLGAFVRDRRGSTAIEYGLIAALIAVGCLAGLQVLGNGNSSSWGSTATKLSDAMKDSGK